MRRRNYEVGRIWLENKGLILEGNQYGTWRIEKTFTDKYPVRFFCPKMDGYVDFEVGNYYCFNNDDPIFTLFKCIRIDRKKAEIFFGEKCGLIWRYSFAETNFLKSLRKYEPSVIEKYDLKYFRDVDIKEIPIDKDGNEFIEKRIYKYNMGNDYSFFSCNKIDREEGVIFLKSRPGSVDRYLWFDEIEKISKFELIPEEDVKGLKKNKWRI